MFVSMVASPVLFVVLASRYYSFHGAESDDDATFERRMDDLCREIGSRGQQQHKLPEAVPPARVSRSSSPAPAPSPVPKPNVSAPVPAPASAVPSAPAPPPASPAVRALAPEQQSCPPNVALTPQQPCFPSAGASNSFTEIMSFMREEREAAKAERAEMSVQIEKLRQEAFESQLREQTPQDAISTEQVVALMARLEALHAAKLLSDEELFVMEDAITDFAEMKAAIGVVTTEMMHANHAVAKVLKLVAVNEAVPRDAMFARQLRRKFL